MKKLVGLLLPLACIGATTPDATLPLPGARLFPESLSSTRDGTLLIGDSEHGAVLRAPGGRNPAVWIKADATNGLGNVFGVLADERNGVLWVCSNDTARAGKTPAIKVFDLKSGALKASYDLPGGGLCNDMVVARDGTLYATHMGGSVLRLRKGATALEKWIEAPEFASADGITILSDGRLLVNAIRSAKLFTVPIQADGSAGKITEVALSRAVASPDGMRTAPDGRVYLIEGEGLSRLTITGDTAKVERLAEKLDGPTGVTLVGKRAWVAEGKLGYLMNPALKGKDPGAFRLIAVTIDR